MQFNADSAELLTKLGDLQDEHGNGTNTNGEADGEDVNNADERCLLDILFEEAEDEELVDEFRPAGLLIRAVAR